MAKGYWLVNIDIANVEAFKAYLAATPPILDRFGARFLARGGRYENPEGTTRSRSTVIEFPSYQAALDCYHCAEYQAAILLRKDVSSMDLVILEGCEAS